MWLQGIGKIGTIAFVKLWRSSTTSVPIPHVSLKKKCKSVDDRTDQGRPIREIRSHWYNWHNICAPKAANRMRQFSKRIHNDENFEFRQIGSSEIYGFYWNQIPRCLFCITITCFLLCDAKLNLLLIHTLLQVLYIKKPHLL